jgi:hypothetical protein
MGLKFRFSCKFKCSAGHEYEFHLELTLEPELEPLRLHPRYEFFPKNPVMSKYTVFVSPLALVIVTTS